MTTETAIATETQAKPRCAQCTYGAPDAKGKAIITSHCAQHKRKYKGSDRPSFTVEMLKDFLHAAKPTKNASTKHLAMFLMMAIHGLRASELAGMKVSDLDLPAKKVLVRRLKGSLTSNQSMQRLNGWDESEVLAAWLKERGEVNNDILFPSREGNGALSRQQIFRIFQNLCVAAKIAPEIAHVHAFRHTLGTLMYENGARLEDIQQQLGHRSITSTTIYASPSQAQVDSKVAKIFKNMR